MGNNMNSKLKSILTKTFYYLYAALLFEFAILVLMLISNVGLEKEVNWNRVYISFGILVPVLILMKVLAKKLERKNVG